VPDRHEEKPEPTYFMHTTYGDNDRDEIVVWANGKEVQKFKKRKL